MSTTHLESTQVVNSHSDMTHNIDAAEDSCPVSKIAAVKENVSTVHDSTHGSRDGSIFRENASVIHSTPNPIPSAVEASSDVLGAELEQKKVLQTDKSVCRARLLVRIPHSLMI